jgi:hypothetical protein
MPESQNGIAFGSEPLVSTTICFFLQDVLSAVNLNDQAALKASKIGDKASEWYLPTKLEAAETAIAQVPPQQPLAHAWCASQILCTIHDARDGVVIDFNPSPSALSPTSWATVFTEVIP